jgi:hypothetical protein
VDAVATALAQNPTVIWVISDGNVPDEDDLLRRLKATVKRKVTINTVVLDDSDNTKRLLSRIARDFGGRCLNAKGGEVVVADRPKPPSQPPAKGPTAEEAAPSIFKEK